MILMAGRSTGRNIMANHPEVPTAPADPLPDLTKTNPADIESLACIESVAYARLFVHFVCNTLYQSHNFTVDHSPRDHFRPGVRQKCPFQVASMTIQ